jgi:ribonuclease HI
MEHIEIYTYGRNFGQSGSVIGIILISKSNLWKRTLAYGKYSTNQADLVAVKFGLSSLSVSSCKLNIKVFTKNKYVIDMIEKDSNGFYFRVPKSYEETIGEVRSFVDFLKTEFILDSKSNNMLECKRLVENASRGETIDYRK